MQRRHTLRDDQWERIKDALPGKIKDPCKTCSDNRLFVEAVIWIAKTGAPWRDLPSTYDKWSNVHKRFMRWAKNGIWQMIFNTLAIKRMFNKMKQFRGIATRYGKTSVVSSGFIQLAAILLWLK
ncbi:MAG: transposase [Desulfovibrio sp.]|jgi:transposase|nr:transposase [Desulfovibrio sp.]